MTPRHAWTPAELQQLRDHYATMPTRQLAHQMSLPIKKVYAQAMRLGLRKSAEFMATSDKTGRILRGGKLSQATQFQKGHTTWNAGRKGWQAGGRSAETQFTTGMVPPNTVPVGSLRTISCKGIAQLERKIGTASGPNHKRWKAVHRLVWEAVNGPVPPGSICVFKPGMRTLVEADITVDKVECITRAQNAQRNHPKNKPPQLAPYIRAKDTATGTFDHKAGVYTIRVNDLGRVTWSKSYDHEDVATDFHADSTLSVIANILASLGVFAMLMCAIAVVAQVPESWLSWIVLALGGV